MANTKLHINLTQGIIEAEGDESFIRFVYDDFKARLRVGKDDEKPKNDWKGDDSAEDSQSSTKPRKARKRAATDNGKKRTSSGGISRYEPKRDPDLDLSALEDFVGQYELKGNPERYLVYVWFLKEKLNIEPCSIDHIYSCFLAMKDDIPVRMGQNLIDTRGRNAFLKFTSPHDITITAVGINHFNKKLKKKAAE
jgi:hypothetical protein